MTSLQQIIDRYKDILPRYTSSVMGYLMWGARQYYAINSDEPLLINSQYGVEFITNKEGLVEEYSIIEDVPNTLYYRDEEQTQEVSFDEFYNRFFKSPHTEEEYSEYYHKYTRNNPDRVKFRYRYKTEELYPHPWYPGRDISHFKVIRIMPGLLPGDEIVQESYEKEQYYLQYPEFFKPIYK